MVSFRTNTRLNLRLILLVAALMSLIFLVCLPWGEDSTRMMASSGEIKRLVDKALDDFVLKFLSKVDVHAEVPEDVVLEIQPLLSCPFRAESRATMSGPTCSSAFLMDICQLLAGKKVLLVGPETTYFLHTLWLDAVESRRNRTHTCPGREFCTFHHICRDPPIFPEDSNTYDRTERKKKIPSDNILRATRSALLQYTYSTTLYAASNKTDTLYKFPLVDLETGVQQVSQYWLRRARKADVVILSRTPIPAPVSTYALGPSGNWTFAFALCSQQKHFPINYCRLSLSYALAIAALDMTLRNFLPLVMETIGHLATDTFRGSHHVWHGNWIIQPSCAVKRLSRDTELLPDFWSCTDLVDSCQVDPWTYLYNVQGTIEISFWQISSISTMPSSLSAGPHPTPGPSLLWGYLSAIVISDPWSRI